MRVVGHQMIDTLYPRFLGAVVEQPRIMMFSSNAGLTVRACRWSHASPWSLAVALVTNWLICSLNAETRASALV